MDNGKWKMDNEINIFYFPLSTFRYKNYGSNKSQRNKRNYSFTD